MAGALVVIGVVVGMVLGAQALIGLVRLSDLHRFTTGEEVDVELRPEQPTSIYVRQDEADTLPLVDCEATAPAGRSIDLSQTDLQTVVLHDGDTWVPEYDIDVSGAGRFTITCEAFNGLSDLALGIGPRADPAATVNRYGRRGLLAVLLIGVGVVLGLVVGLRRVSHQRRLLVERRPGRAG
jgi:hypothetical protein